MDNFEMLLEARAALFGQWMTYVDAAKAAGWDAHRLSTAGVILDSKGNLRLTAYGERRQPQLEMTMGWADDEVKIGFESLELQVLMAG
jgi:hypothetical protein